MSEVSVMARLHCKISIVLICLMCVVVIGVNIKSDALEFSKVDSIINSANEDMTEFTQYYVDDELICIDNISLEAAVDNNYESIDTEAYIEYEATGTITAITTEAQGSTDEVTEDSSSLYYLGETDIENEGVLSDSHTTSDEIDADYYVENWEELPGELSIWVNKQASCVTVYKGDTPIRAMVCSAGESTPEGTFYMQSQWDWLLLIKGQYGRYCSQISGDYLFHSVPYNSMDEYDLDTEMYNQLGTLCSHGCIRLKCEDAKWIYDNCTTGTEIVIYNNIIPGPLGKPSFEKIPETQTYDPTDIEINN